MKRYLLILIICSTQNMFCQNRNLSVQNPIESSIEVLAKFSGGEEKFKKYISDNLKLPEVENEIKGEIRLSFVIETDGSLGDIKLVKNNIGKIGEEIAIDAIRVLSSCPKWNPATINGKATRMMTSIPLTISR